MTTHRIALRRFAHGVLAVAVALLAGTALAPDAFAQGYCTIPGTPPFPPPPQKPPKPCAPYKCKNCSESPCFLASGVYTASELDFRIDTPGFPLMAARNYESNRAVDGPIGVGWSTSLMPRVYHATYLFSAPSTYVHQVELLTMSGPTLTFTANADGTFTPPSGSRDRLVRNGDQTFDWFPEHTDTRIRFNADGTVQQFVDQWNNTLSFIHGGNGRLSRVQDDTGSGRYFDVGWGADGRIATITDHSGRVVRYEYGSDGTLIRVTNPASQVTKLTYVSGRFGPLLASVKDHWDRVITQLEWYDDDKLESYSEGEYTGTSSRGERFSYQYFSGQTTRTHSLGAVTRSWNSSNWIVTKPGSSVDHSTGAPLQETDGTSTTTYTYDSLGRRASMRKGNVSWKFTYDPNFPNAIASSIAYSNAGMTTVHPDWAGYHFIYAAPGTPGAGALKEVRQVRSDGTTQEWIEKYDYDARGRMTSHTDVSTFTTSFGYNAQGDVTTVTTPTGTTTLEYDTHGRVTSVTNEMGKTTSFTYDVLDRKLTETLPAPSAALSPFTTTYSYDHYDGATGFTYTHVTDPNGRTRKYGFDALGNQTEEIDELGNATSYNYKYNLLDNITDANGNVTRYVYNANREHAQTVFPDGKTESVSTSGSTVTSKTDRRGITTTYTYDGFNRPTFIRWMKNGQTLESTTLSYAGQKLMSVTYQKGTVSDTISYTYDDAYRLLTETQGTRAKITYGYASFTPSQRLMSYSVGPVAGGAATSAVSYGYDSKSRIRTITWSKLPGTITFTYNALDQYTQILFPTGNKRLYTYDDQARIASVSNTDSNGGNMVRYTYSWDYNWAALDNSMRGQISHVDVVADSNTGQQVGRTKYTYDHKYQLIRADYPDTTWEAWTFDPIGNRLTRTATYNTPVTYTYVQNATGRNTSRVLSDGASGNYVYDDAGNFIGRTAFNTPHEYDAQNRLTNVGSIVEAVYDAAGRRIKSRAGSAIEKSYVYMGEQVVQEKTAYWNHDFTYLMGPGLDEPLAVALTDGTVHYLAVEAQGSVLGLIAAADDGYSHPMSYQPYGRELQIPDTNNIPSYGFTGRERSPSGYWYYRFRHYDSRLGRFTSEDPIQEYVPVTGAAQYGYVSNSPVMYTDPYGLVQCNTEVKWGSSYTQEGWSMDWILLKKWDLPIVGGLGPGSMFKFLGFPKNSLASVGTGETCLWRGVFVSTMYLIKKWSAITTCICPDSVDVFASESKTILGKSFSPTNKTKITNGALLPGKYLPCKKPS